MSNKPDNSCPEKDRDSSRTVEISTFTSLAGLRVLVVDDDGDNLILTETIFQLYQTQVKTASSADEAIKVIEEWQPDILVSDICMSEKDGYSLIRSIRIKEAEYGGFLPAIALTSYAFPENRGLAFDAGFQMFITKPFDFDELVEIVLKLTGRTLDGIKECDFVQCEH